MLYARRSHRWNKNKTAGTRAHAQNSSTPCIPEDQTTKTTLWGFWDQMPPPPPPPPLDFPLSPTFLGFFFFFFSFLVFSFFLPRSPFSFHTLSFLARVRRCCRGTNRLFCKIAQNFKVCLTCTLGRPAVGASVSHTETWGRVLKAPCVSTLLTFKGARSMLSLTWLLWIKYVSSLSQRLPWYTVDHNAASDCRGAAKTKGCTAYKSIKKLFLAFHSAFDTREAPFFFFCPGCHVCVDRF